MASSTKMKVYDLVKQILEEYPDCRNSDKRLIWLVMNRKQLITHATVTPLLSRLTFQSFMQAPSFESITRARRKIQELHPELQATSSSVRTRRKQKAETKGTFIYREKIKTDESNKNLYYVKSFSNPKKEYIVRMMPNFTWRCTCPAFIFNEKKTGTCKHIERVQNARK